MKSGLGGNSGFDPYALYAGDNAMNPNFSQDSIASETVRSTLATLLMKNGFHVAANMVKQTQQSKEQHESGIENCSGARTIPTTYDQHPIQTLYLSAMQDDGRDTLKNTGHLNSMW